MSTDSSQLLPELTSRGGSLHELVAALGSARAIIERQSGGSEQTGQAPGDSTRQLLDTACFGGESQLKRWLADARQLRSEQLVQIGPSLCDVLTMLARGLPAPALVDLTSTVSALVCTLSGHIQGEVQKTVNDQCPQAEAIEALAKAAIVLLATTGQRLHEVMGLGIRGDDLQRGFSAGVTLLSEVPSTRAAPGACAAETWLKAVMASTASGSDAQCFALLSAAEKDGCIKLMNVAWRLLKSVCLHPACGFDTVRHALERSAKAAATHLVAAASAPASSSSSSAPNNSKDPLFIATFHCSNLIRVAQEAPALRDHAFPAYELITVLAPAANATAAADASNAQELLDKLVTLVLKRWLESPPEACDKSMVARDFGPFLETTASASLLIRTTLILFASAHCNGSASQLRPREEALLGTVLRMMDRCLESSEACPWSAGELDALAVMCSAGLPGCRRSLLTWMTSRHAKSYSIALQLHTRMPKWMGVKRSLSWCQMVVQEFLAVLEKASGKPSLGRVHQQTASCLAALLSQLPSKNVEAWLQSALAPLVAAGKKQTHPAVWLLARRLGVSLADSGSNVIGDVASSTMKEIQRSAEEPASSVQANGLRCFSTLACRGFATPEQLANAGAGLRSILSKIELPPAVRLEAWVAHAHTCRRTDAVDDFRVSLRYAVKHLASDISAGARVAAVLAKAPAGFWENAAATLEGLCSVEWPLRSAGLAAAKAIAVRSSGLAIPQSNAAAVAAAECALEAFAEEYGFSRSDWAPPSASPYGSDSQGMRAWHAKRRRLMLELVNLPDKGKPAADADFADLCIAVRSRMDAWMQASG